MESSTEVNVDENTNLETDVDARETTNDTSISNTGGGVFGGGGGQSGFGGGTTFGGGNNLPNNGQLALTGGDRFTGFGSQP